MAVALGVALAFSVHLINASALDEFAGAVRSISGQADLQLRSANGRIDERIYAQAAAHPAVALASPVLEVQTYLIDATGRRIALKVVGLDALVVAALSPSLMPHPAATSARLAVLAPENIFLNAAAERALGLVESPADEPRVARLQAGLQVVELNVAGRVPGAPGGPLAVMDIAAAQVLFGQVGRLSRIDLRLQPGANLAVLQAEGLWPLGVQAVQPEQDGQRASQLSLAYRVNLTVLALVALFTGAFLVFSVMALGVAQRAPQWALLGVLGLTGLERRTLVLAEAMGLGLLGSLAGLALGTGLAALALRLLGGDLGGGYFAGVAPVLAFSWSAAAAYGALGVLAALVGAWWPARSAALLPPAQTLKGAGLVGSNAVDQRLALTSLVLLAGGGLLALAPPVGGLPVAAYASVALLLLGGISALPALIAALCALVQPLCQRRPLALLALERARRVQGSAAVAVSGVVAALSLAVALTVMVASFRGSVMQWLDQVLPADLYVRSAQGSAAGDTVYFQPAVLQAVQGLPGVARATGLRSRSLLLDPALPPVVLVSRPLFERSNTAGADSPRASLAPAVQSTEAPALPLVGDLSRGPWPAEAVLVYVSEAMVDLHGARLGQPLPALSQALLPDSNTVFVVAGVWRDYARQFGAVALDQADYQRLTGDLRVNDIAITLADGANAQDVQQAVRQVVVADAGAQAEGLLEFASAADIRAVSLRIFDRSFAVTYWLQAVAIGIGLFGVAATFSAQVLARRKEFGLLAHLGLTRRQVLTVVAGEGLVWSSIGALAGVGLGLLVSLVLVHVVNPQSFHWTMDMALPAGRLTLLALAVVAAGTATAWLSGRRAASADAVQAVKEDW